MLIQYSAVGRNDLTTICMTLQRLVAVAEIMGLPRVSYEQAASQSPVKDDPYHQAKIKIWEAICATDRNFGMMLKLPAGTTNSVFPLHIFARRESGDISQSYNYFLARICGMVIDVDKSYSNGDSEVDSYKTVIAVDRALKSLACQVPKAWLTSAVGKASDLIVKFWHPYILSRAHLRPAMISRQEYQQSRDVVRLASFDAVRMFCGFRTSLSRGFFYCRVLDIQAFTSALMLLLFRDDADRDACRRQDELIDRLLECFGIISASSASSFARKAVQSISLLKEFILGRPTSSTTIHIPLLGNVRIEALRKSPADCSTQLTHNGPLDQKCVRTIEELFDPVTNSSSITTNTISFTIDFENDSPWTPPASRAGGYGRD